MSYEADVQRFTRSVLELVRETVSAASDNIVAVSIVYAESQESVQAYVMSEETLKEYARHLAEKIRNASFAHDYDADTAQRMAADLIDPDREVEQ